MNKLFSHKDGSAARGYRPYRGAKSGPAWYVWLLLGALLLALSAFFWFGSRSIPALGAGMRRGALAVSAFLSRLTGLVPIPLSEWLLGGVTLGPLIWLIVTLLRRRWAALGRGLCFLIFLGSLILFLFVSLFLVQHSAAPLASRLGFSVDKHTADQLADYVAYTVEQTNALADKVPRTAAGDCDFGSFRALSALVQEEYDRLASENPVFAVPRPGQGKRSLLGGRIMSLIDLAGYYFPYTGEQIVSADVVPSHIPFDVAHEGAHARGIAPEDECNFAAWLVLKDSGDVRLRYSAWLNAYIYANNALFAVDRERATALYSSLSGEARHDLSVLNESLRRFEGKLNDLGSAVNDAYIKATGQPEGVRSYGKVVDLLLAWHDREAAQ